MTTESKARCDARDKRCAICGEDPGLANFAFGLGSKHGPACDAILELRELVQSLHFEIRELRGEPGEIPWRPR